MKLMKVIPRAQLEINSELVLSTTHITKEDAELLGSYDFVVDYGYGLRLFANPDKETRSEYTDMSSSFMKLYDLAILHGCKWLVLDCDGPVVEGLKRYDW